jgi:hypothetical protein
MIRKIVCIWDAMKATDRQDDRDIETDTEIQQFLKLNGITFTVSNTTPLRGEGHFATPIRRKTGRSKLSANNQKLKRQLEGIVSTNKNFRFGYFYHKFFCHLLSMLSNIVSL